MPPNYPKTSNTLALGFRSFPKSCCTLVWNFREPPKASRTLVRDFRTPPKTFYTLAWNFRRKIFKINVFSFKNTFNLKTENMNSIDLPKLRNAEYLQYMKDFAGIINLNNPAALQIDAKLSAFNAKTVELENLFKKALANDRTKVILALDERRDDAINGISFFLQGYAYHFDADKKKNAQLLLANMNIYGSGIARQNYQSETATINNMLTDWGEKTDLIDAVTSFSLNTWVNELSDANTQFNTEYLSRTQEYGDANPETIKSKREEVNVAYYALRDRIDALHTLVETPPSPYTTVINQLNALTEQYNVLLLKRTDGLPPEEPENPA